MSENKSDDPVVRATQPSKGAEEQLAATPKPVVRQSLFVTALKLLIDEQPKVTVRPTHIELTQSPLDACVHEQKRGHMDTSQPDAGVARSPRRSCRRHSGEFKVRVIKLARQGHESVAAVALANGLNANMLRRWVRESEMVDAAPPAVSAQAANRAPASMAVPLADLGDRTAAAFEPTAGASAPERVTLEIRRGTTSVSASLPLDERSAAWLREVLA